jgi:hypothetical protein
LDGLDHWCCLDLQPLRPPPANTKLEASETHSDDNNMTTTVATSTTTSATDTANTSSTNNNGQNNTKLGMTWSMVQKNATWDIVYMGCKDCDAYQGDTPCSTSLPLLCVKIMDILPRPPYPVLCGLHAMEGAFYCGWLSGWFAVGPTVEGYNLTSRAVADGLCEASIGPGYRLVEHHDGQYMPGMDGDIGAGATWHGGTYGGWTAWGYEKCFMEPGPYWAAINDQPANCWDSID